MPGPTAHVFVGGDRFTDYMCGGGGRGDVENVTVAWLYFLPLLRSGILDDQHFDISRFARLR